jgi:DNA-directed RNA polymerase subunit F
LPDEFKTAQAVSIGEVLNGLKNEDTQLQVKQNKVLAQTQEYAERFNYYK